MNFGLMSVEEFQMVRSQGSLQSRREGFSRAIYRVDTTLGFDPQGKDVIDLSNHILTKRMNCDVDNLDMDREVEICNIVMTELNDRVRFDQKINGYHGKQIELLYRGALLYILQLFGVDVTELRTKHLQIA